MQCPKQTSVRRRSDAELVTLAATATYVGSPEHKERRWWGGIGMARQLPGGRLGRPGKQTTTVCPLVGEEDRDRAITWVQAAIRAGQCIFQQSDQRFPKKIWYEADGQVWMGLRVTDQLGEYKGWPISREERDAIFG